MLDDDQVDEEGDEMRDGKRRRSLNFQASSDLAVVRGAWRRRGRLFVARGGRRCTHFAMVQFRKVG